MIEVYIGVLAFMVAVLAVLQGWQMRQKHNHNPSNLVLRLDTIITKLGTMEQRLNDIWDKVKGE